MASNLRKMFLTRAIRRRAFCSEAYDWSKYPRAGAHPGEDADRLRLMWKRLSIGGFVVMGICTAYNVLLHFEHKKHWKQPEWVPYSYLAIRKKKFPWGDGNHSLFHNPLTNALPDGYEKTP